MAGTPRLMGDRGRLELSLPPEPASVGEARARVLEAIGSGRLADGQVETLRLLVSEVVTNAVRHGGATAPVELRAAWNDEIRVEVIDRGEGFVPHPRVASSSEPGGFGLYLVGRLAARWGVESNGATRVWFALERGR
jgi:anti-sigma regulatory factor (Ser/Thr protein kinase)